LFRFSVDQLRPNSLLETHRVTNIQTIQGGFYPRQQKAASWLSAGRKEGFCGLNADFLRYIMVILGQVTHSPKKEAFNRLSRIFFALRRRR